MLPYMRSASKRATEIYQETGLRARIEQDGYTRVDPFLVAGRHGIPVLLRPMDKLLGAFIRDEVSGILINSERPAGLIHMTCAHELGHYFLGHHTMADDSMDFGPGADLRELEADWFAYQLLAPRLLIANVMRRKGLSIQSLKNPLEMYQLALRLGISYSAAAWSMVRQGLMSNDAARSLLVVTPSAIKQSLLGERPLDPRKDVWLLDERDRGSVIEPRHDDQIVLRLGSQSSSGYLWSVDELVSEGFVVRPRPSNISNASDIGSIVFGSPQTVDFLLDHPSLNTRSARAPLQFAMQLIRPWKGRDELADRFEVRTQLESLGPGLTHLAKDHLLGGM